MSAELLSVRGLSAGYGPLRVLHDIDFSNAKDKQAKFFHAFMRDGVIDVNACAATGVVA